MRLLTDADAWTSHQPTTYAELNYQRDQGREQAARAAACMTAPAAPILRIDGTYVATDCTEVDLLASVDLPDDQPEPVFIEGHDDYPELLNDMRDEGAQR